MLFCLWNSDGIIQAWKQGVVQVVLFFKTYSDKVKETVLFFFSTHVKVSWSAEQRPTYTAIYYNKTSKLMLLHIAESYLHPS